MLKQSFLKTVALSSLVLVTMAACSSDVSYAQKESPTNIFKDYNESSSAVVGVGTPISQRRMRANATLDVIGSFSLEDIMGRVASTYNLAVRWDDSVRKVERKKVLIKKLTFDESRGYIEDVYGVQIVREGERRLLVMPSIDEARIENFKPGSNVTLSQLVRGLAEQCDYNVVITENKKALATTLITTSFKDVSCLDAFDAVLSPQGLSLENHGDFYTIAGFPQRQWLMDLYEPIRTETQEINYSSDISGGGDDEGESSASVSAGGSGKVSVENTRDLWQELEEDLASLIQKSCGTLQDNGSVPFAGFGTSEGVGEIPVSTRNETEAPDIDGSFQCGYVRINRSVGLVQMRAPQAVLSQADEIIRFVEDVASRRLLVEARIIGVARKRAFEQGSNLSSGVSGSGNSKVGLATVGEHTSIATAINNSLASITGTGYGGALAVTSGNLEAAVRIAESFGTTYQLLQPTMEVMDRQRAVIVDGRNEKYFLIDSSQETTTTGGLTSTSVEQRTQFVGIQFSVTAQISGVGEPHTLHIQVPITEIDRFVIVPDGSQSEVPIVTTRVIDQKIRLRDGEVKVIGGLTRTLAIDRESGIPLIRNMPVAGVLLGDENITYEKVEFIVLLQAKRLY